MTKYAFAIYGIATLTLISGLVPVARAATPPPPPGTRVVAIPVAPEPGIVVSVGVPDDYIWDGFEYVGVIGDRYYYLGPGNIWLLMDPDRLARFHSWERFHHDWRAHMIRNERYRRDAQGHEHPWRENGHHDFDHHHHDHDGH